MSRNSKVTTNKRIIKNLVKPKRNNKGIKNHGGLNTA